LIDSELHVEANKSYLAYALSVIVGRALPDARDGLKPVHRRILYAMNELGLSPNKPYRKCARVVGEVLGKFHPHGDVAVYDSMVRMAQTFSLRHLLIQGHGNFGSQDDDPPAAMRYTESRLSPFSVETLLQDLDKSTVGFSPNFDVSTTEPTVLPARVPQLLVNGAQGIAVGVATNIPPHNLGEIVQGLIAYMDNPSITTKELMRHIPAPDFPTGGLIVAGDSNLKQIYEKGNGSVVIRSRSHIEDTQGKRGKRSIIVTEIPYQVSKSSLIEQIAEQVDAGKIQGITDIRDESDRDGMRIVIDVQGNQDPDLVLNNLYIGTRLQQRFNCNVVALVNQQPLTLSLGKFFEQFLAFRVEVVENRAEHELSAARKRHHIVDGYLRVFANGDGEDSGSSLNDAIELIKNAKDSAGAEEALKVRFGLSSEQAKSVLGIPLRRLTSMEVTKVRQERDQLVESISNLDSLLNSREMVLDVVKKEALEIAEKHGDERRSTVLDRGVSSDLALEDLVPNDPCIIVVSEKGYVKRMKEKAFQVQGRNTKGKLGGKLRADDLIAHVFHAQLHDKLLCFSSNGKVFTLPAYEVPEGSRSSMGMALPRILKKWDDSSVTSVFAVSREEFEDEDNYLVLLSKNGLIKRSKLSLYQNVRANGLIGLRLQEGDSLGWVSMATESKSCILSSKSGQTMRFPLDGLRPSSRATQGCFSMKLSEGDVIAGMDIIPTEEAKSGSLLVVTSQGMAKRVPLASYKDQKRNGMGVKGIKLKDQDEVMAIRVLDADMVKTGDVLVATLSGNINRISLEKVAAQSRTAQGSQLISLNGETDKVQSIAIMDNEE
jgi:DNA gyrase subunit A